MEDSAPAIANNSDLNVSGKGSIQAQFSDTHKRKFDQITSPTKSVSCPCHHSPKTMTSVEWLQTVICPLPLKPSPELERFFSSCDRDIATAVSHRANIILEAIFNSDSLQRTSLSEGVWAKQRKSEALKLYYKVLETMCIAEAKIKNVQNLTPLLTNERFHRSLLACSAELVLVARKTMTMVFPAVIERAGITAFDLSKVIESFIRHEESLPRELRRHLNSLEEQLLESLVWEKGSSMYNELAVAKPVLSLEINRLGLLAKSMPSLEEISVDMDMDVPFGSVPCVLSDQAGTLTGQCGDILSPKRPRTRNRSALVERSPFKSPLKDLLFPFNNLKSKPQSPCLQTAVVSPAKQYPDEAEICAETVINVFFNKVVKLAAVRINEMIKRLQLSQDTRESVYALFQKILREKTTLFFNRHVDQIILCCLYIITKVSKAGLTFTEIVSQYKMQSHCYPQVQNVFVQNRSEQKYVGIMIFYNDIFVISVRPFVLEFEPVGSAQNTSLNSENENNSNSFSPGTPKLSSFPKIPDMSPRKVSAKHNVYVSPLRATKRDALMSNSSKSYYACIGESTHAFQSPSKDLVDINNRLNGNRKVRGMLKFDDLNVEFGFVSNSMVEPAATVGGVDA